MYDENPRRKVCNTLVSCEFENDSIFLPPPPPPNTERTKRRRIKKKKKTMPRIRVSSSSTDSGLFSSEGLDDDNDPENGMGNEETETLVSSTRSFFY